MSCSCGGSCKDPVKFDVHFEFMDKTYGVIDTVVISDQVVFVCVDYSTGKISLFGATDTDQMHVVLPATKVKG